MDHKRKTYLERGVNSGRLLVSSKYIGVKYSRSRETARNWGDALNAYILPKLTGRTVLHISEYFNLGLFPTLSAIGSILDNNRTNNLHVWGSGFKSGNASMYVLPRKISAVRGPLTHKRFEEFDVECPPVYGDPALILPRYYRPEKVIKKYRIGVVLHYADKADPALRLLHKQTDVCFIDIESDIEEFVDKIVSCESIVSSSLHGLIAADAYGIPRVWLKLSKRISGGNFKFEDYFSTTDYSDVRSITGEEALNSLNIQKCLVQPQKMANVDKLIEVFPFNYS